MKRMMEGYVASPLFLDMSPEEIGDCIAFSGAQIRSCEKNEMVFTALDTPKSIFVLMEGSVLICKDTLSGKRDIFLNVNRPGDVFGEVYLFMGKDSYEYYSVAQQKITVLEIPKAYFYHTCPENCTHHTKLIRNMLQILAHKAFHFNLKLQILASGNLRQKIARYLLENLGGNKTVIMSMNREMFADYLNVARPSLSRELIKMDNEGLVRLDGKKISIPDPNMLEECL